MTTSIIQDYVPDEYEKGRQTEKHIAAARTPATEEETHHEYCPKLATMPEDGVTASDAAVREYGQQGGVEGQGDGAGAMSGLGVALLQHSVDNPSASGATVEGYSSMSYGQRRGIDADRADEVDADVGPGPDVLHWPSPEQGHGYADKRVHKLPGQGPAPFLTPGPHRHKLVRGGRQG